MTIKVFAKLPRFPKTPKEKGLCPKLTGPKKRQYLFVYKIIITAYWQPSPSTF